MKISKTKVLIGFIATIFISSCQNEPITFGDFDYSTTYFAWQYPVRTLVLGETSYYDNSNDLKHQFEIKASIGGLYENKKDLNVEYELDPSLADSLATKIGTDTVHLKMLPQNYYELMTTGNIVIHKGSFNGGVTIKLTDAFFNDPLACTNKYILPLRLISSDTDSILSGKQTTSATESEISSIALKWGVDPRVLSNWDIKPKNYTIFVIKYSNKYHGSYLKRGFEKEITSGSTSMGKGYGWENKYIEYTNYIPKLTTISLNKLLYADKLAVATTVNFKAVIEILSDSVKISKDSSSPTDIVGTGKYVTGIEQWGGKKRDAFYLDFTVSDPLTQKVYSVKDTLVIRDNAIALEEFTPIILPKRN